MQIAGKFSGEAGGCGPCMIPGPDTIQKCLPSRSRAYSHRQFINPESFIGKIINLHP
jgi:hypothetical protein